jgi:4-diphosphocytidyl-2-C-methyl-D-erythritol kinase
MLKVRAPAKLNLFLRIVGRRPDGYHELETVFQAIDLCDELTFTPADGLHLSGGCMEAPPTPENLVLRAAHLLRTATGSASGAAIHLEKRIPVGAGLGGGSSDAAATLVALNRLWSLDLPDGRLAELAAELGSDVPFALLGGTALGRGRGEVLEPLAPPGCWCSGSTGPRESDGKAGSCLVPDSGSVWFVLVRPSFLVSTAEAYCLYRPAPSDAPALESFLAAMKTNDLDRLAPLLRNDLEAGVFGAWPELSALRQRLLQAGALGARMTGSGSVIFGVARDEGHAKQIAIQIRTGGLWVRVVKAIDWGVQTFVNSDGSSCTGRRADG